MPSQDNINNAIADAIADGTSQAARLRPELDPAFALIDGRTSADLLAFARAYAAELVYVDGDGQPQGDWRGLLPGADADANANADVLRDAAQYLQAPEHASAEQVARYGRPHFALLLAFIDLLGLARDQINGLTARHLDFYYRQVLHMVRKRAVPDAVHVLVLPDPRSSRLRLPAGTGLRAGKDSQGLDLTYRTQADLLLSPVQVAQLRSLRADIRITGIRQAMRQHLVGGTRQAAFMAMLRITLGSPAPGDALPLPVLPGLPAPPPAGQAPEPLAIEPVLQAQQIVGFVDSGLGLALFDHFRSLMALRSRRLANDPADWARINAVLAQAGRQRDPAFVPSPTQPADFVANLRSALGLTPAQYAKLYDRLPEVASADDAYAVLDDRPDVQAFVQAELYLPLADFSRMMSIKWLLDRDWDGICRLIDLAGQRRQPGFALSPALRQGRDVDAMLGAALGAVAWPVAGGLDGLQAAFAGIERYFCMSAERFHFIVAVLRRSLALPDSVPPDGADWARVFLICADANAELVFRRRREVLQTAAAPGLAAVDLARAMADMLAVVLGEAVDVPAGLQRLVALGEG